MKKLITVTFILILSKCAFAQIPLVPSTIGQVYSYDVGDTFEYTTSNNDPFCHNQTTILRVVISYSRTNDSIIIGQKQYEAVGNYPCDPNIHAPFGTLFDSTSFSTSIYNPDSSIFSIPFPFGLTSSSPFVHDTVYIRGINNYNGKKQNELSIHGLSSVDQIWADSLGLIHERDFLEGQLSTIYTWDLIYYHKTVSGEIWGTFLPFAYQSIGLGIDDISISEIQIFPNPATSLFTIAIPDASMLDYKNVRFTLFDLTGREILSLTIDKQSTTIYRNNISDGLYLWRISDNNRNISNGKFIFR